MSRREEALAIALDEARAFAARETARAEQAERERDEWYGFYVRTRRQYRKNLARVSQLEAALRGFLAAWDNDEDIDNAVYRLRALSTEGEPAPDDVDRLDAAAQAASDLLYAEDQARRGGP